MKAGIHHLDWPLEIAKALSFISEGMETTRVVCSAAGTVIRYAGDGIFSASDLSFIQQGTEWGDAFITNRGEVSLTRCRFTGGVHGNDNHLGRDGLWLYGTVRGRLTACQATGNNPMGIRVSGQAQPTLEGNTCQGSKWDGIAYHGATSGAARWNTCTVNEDGIYVASSAHPTLQDNPCWGNKRSDINDPATLS